MASERLGSNERQIIEEVIGPQLQNERFVEIPTNLTTYKISYCLLESPRPIFPNHILLLQTGFGSGWTGASLLGYELAKRGHTVCMVSNLGYGNSDETALFNLRKNDFVSEATALYGFIRKLFPDKNLILVGHSMGCPILAELASMSRSSISSLILLNPVGFHKRRWLSLALNFFCNGIGHAIAFALSGNRKWKLLNKFLPKEKSAFAKDRLRQRWSESIRLCNDSSLESLQRVAKKIPVHCIYGMRDSVVGNHLISCSSVAFDFLPLWYNTTMFGSDLTAKAIDEFIFKIIKSR